MKELDEVMMGRVYARWGMIFGGTVIAVVGVILSRRFI
jgi:hypothetical protein